MSDGVWVIIEGVLGDYIAVCGNDSQRFPDWPSLQLWMHERGVAYRFENPSRCAEDAKLRPR